MIINYKKNELKGNANFNIMYDFLTKYDCYIVAGIKDIDATAELSDLWNFIVCNGDYIKYRHYGSSATTINKSSFKWLINEIFNDCNTFTAIDRSTYDKLYLDSLKKNIDAAARRQ